MNKNAWAFRLFLGTLLWTSVLIGQVQAEEPAIQPGVLIVKLKAMTGLSVYTATSALDKLNAQIGIVSQAPIQFPSKTKALQAKANPTLFIYQLPSNITPTEAAKLYQAQPGIEYAEPCYYVQLDEAPNQPIQQPYLFKTELKNMLLLPSNSDIVVAVIDSGVDSLCPDLQDKVDTARGYNFYGWMQGNLQLVPRDDYGHGTHIAGIIAASANGTVGITGLNTKAKILPIRFTDGGGRGTQLDAAAAIHYAVDMKARIINCSWGYYQYNQVLKEAIEYALSKGVIVIAAVGNDGFNAKQYPAAFDGVLSIGSVDAKKKHLAFSNSGDYLDFVTYGDNLYSTLPNGQYGAKSGTSQSAALFTGIVARILSFKTELSPKELQTLLIQNSDLIDTASKDELTGYGILNIPKLFKALDAPVDLENPTQEEHEALWITVLLLPLRLLEGLFKLF